MSVNRPGVAIQHNWKDDPMIKIRSALFSAFYHVDDLLRYPHVAKDRIRRARRSETAEKMASKQRIKKVRGAHVEKPTLHTSGTNNSSSMCEGPTGVAWTFWHSQLHSLNLIDHPEVDRAATPTLSNWCRMFLVVPVLPLCHSL